MIGRLPLWATLLPLLLGIAVWALVWRGYEQQFTADLQALMPAESAIDAGGFPYRLEARIAPFTFSSTDEALGLEARAAELTVNRVPWQRDRQVINLRDSDLALSLKPLSGAMAGVTAQSAQASLRMQGKRIARLSGVWEEPKLRTGLFAAPVTAAHFEAHLRETPAASGTPASGPRFPTQAQLVLGGRDVRFGEGAPLSLALDAELTAAGPVESLAQWRDGGTVEIRSATLADPTGEVARLSATLAAGAGGAIELAGTIETVCPANVRAALAGDPPVAEQRSRKPERIAVSGTLPGGLVAAPRDPSRQLPPVRGQQPPCPRLR